MCDAPKVFSTKLNNLNSWHEVWAAEEPFVLVGSGKLILDKVRGLSWKLGHHLIRCFLLSYYEMKIDTLRRPNKKLK